MNQICLDASPLVTIFFFKFNFFNILEETLNRVSRLYQIYFVLTDPV